jgi:hypothetical protein
MNNLLKTFSATLSQVQDTCKERFGATAVKKESQSMSLAMSLTQASERFTVNAKSAAGAVTLAAAALASPSIGYAQEAIDYNYQTPQSTQSEQSKSDNTSARVGGGLLGGILGLAMTQHSPPAVKAVVTGGLAFLGAGVADGMANKKVTDENGNLVTRTVDAQGRPVYQSLGAGIPLPGTPGRAMPQKITSETYREAIDRSASSMPYAARKSREGQQYKTLEPSTHRGLYGLMVDTVSARAIAKIANSDLDAADLARTVARNDPQKQAAFSAANLAYKNAFKAYAESHQQTHAALNVAERSGFDVSAQRLLMNLVPSDLRAQTGASIHWPGVDERIRELGSKMNLESKASMETLAIESQQATRVEDSFRSRE